MILARLLTPTEIGVYSVTLAVTGIAQMLREFGVGSFLIQEKELTKDKIRTALSITMLTSWTAGALFYFSRYWVADFYNEPAMILLIEIQCINFILIPFSTPVLALLNREMKFGTLYRINFISTVTHTIVTLSLASSGYGFFSLAWGAVANIVCSTLLLNANRPKEAWVLPGFKEWRRITNFGIQSSFIALIREIALNFNDLILGRVFGFHLTAIYSRAQGLMYLFHRDIMEAIRKVAFPSFSQAVREEKNLLKPYLLSVNLITVFAWPFYAFLGLYADTIVNLMFGDQWGASGPLVRILVFAGSIAALWNLASSSLMAMGHINKILRGELIIQLIRIALIIYASMFNIEMVCYALIIVNFINLLVTIKYLKQTIGLKLHTLLSSNINSFIVTLISMTIPALCFYYLPTYFNSIHTLLISCLACSISWLIAIFVTKHPISLELLRLTKRNLLPQDSK